MVRIAAVFISVLILSVPSAAQARGGRPAEKKNPEISDAVAARLGKSIVRVVSRNAGRSTAAVGLICRRADGATWVVTHAGGILASSAGRATAPTSHSIVAEPLSARPREFDAALVMHASGIAAFRVDGAVPGSVAQLSDGPIGERLTFDSVGLEATGDDGRNKLRKFRGDVSIREAQGVIRVAHVTQGFAGPMGSAAFNSKGEAVGICSAIGAFTFFADIADDLDGRVQALDITEVRAPDGAVKGAVRVTLVNPIGNIKTVRLLASEDAGRDDAIPDARTGYKALVGAIAHELEIAGSSATGEVELVDAGKPAGRFRVQVHIISSRGKGRYTEPKSLALKAQTQAEPPKSKPAIDPPLRNLPALAEDREILLANSLDDYALAEGGRMLVLRLVGSDQLSLVDLADGRIVRQVALPSMACKFAAGGTSIVAFDPESRQFHIFSLTGEQRGTVAFPDGPQVVRMYMSPHQGDSAFVLVGTPVPGSVASGNPPTPLKGSLSRLDLTGLLLVEEYVEGSFYTQAKTQPSFDSGLRTIVKGGPEFVEVTSLLAPSPRVFKAKPPTDYGWTVAGDDNRIYRANGRVLDARGAELAAFPGQIIFPGIGGGFFAAVSRDGAITIYEAGQSQPCCSLGTFPNWPADMGMPTQTSEQLAPWKRLALIPAIGRALLFPGSNDRVILRPLDPIGAAAKSNPEYLIVTSTPPARVAPNKAMEYRIVTATAKGGTRSELEIGPEGMRVDPAGVVTWTPGDSDVGNLVHVAVRLTSSAGKQAYHRFVLEVGETLSPGRLPETSDHHFSFR
ncbi:MAG: hypothetical protein IT450_05090 [Phycisphaerales bacterium]|nr:hypothetical protein [Phycisphaerales bacterium]